MYPMLLGDLLPVFQWSLLCPACYDYPEDGGSRLFQNDCNKLPMNTVISQKSVIFNFHSNPFSGLILEPVDSQIQKWQDNHYSTLSHASDNLQTVLSCINPSVMVDIYPQSSSSFIHSLARAMCDSCLPFSGFHPFLSVVYFFPPSFSTSQSSILLHFFLPSISWSPS